MKPTHLTLLMCALALGSTGVAQVGQAGLSKAPATQLKLDPHYAAREASAPANIKTQLASLRKTIADGKLKYQVGFTSALERPLSQLAGEKTPADQAVKARSWVAVQTELLNLDKQAEADYIRMNPKYHRTVLPTPSASAAAFDWRRYGKVTAIRDQGYCGSCWAFAVAGTYESSYLIRNNRATDTAEQALLSCSGAGSCAGGDRSAAYTYMVGHGYGAETSFPYTHTDAPCHTYPVSAKPVAWGFVDAANEIPSVATLKQAIIEHGPISVSVKATGSFQGYAGGIFYEAVPAHDTNHAVVLIGWDDSKSAWLLRNSWGTGWGETCGYGSERGYMWIAYNSSNVGRWARWILAEHALYVNPNILKVLEKYQAFKLR